jgi:APA family basic amino acid/polyamine antiporter
MLFGPIGGKLISIGIIVSIFGCLNGKVLSFPRVIFAMAEKKQLPFSRWISHVHPAFHTPWIAVIVQMMFAVILMIISNPEKLSEVSIFMIYIFYVMAFFAVFILRRRKNGQGRATACRSTLTCLLRLFSGHCLFLSARLSLTFTAACGRF